MKTLSILLLLVILICGEVKAEESIVLPSKKISLTVRGGYGYLLGSTSDGKSNLMDMGFDFNSATDYYSVFRNSSLSSLSLHYTLLDVKDFYCLSLGALYEFQYNSASIAGIMDPGDNMHFINGVFSQDVYMNFYSYSLKHAFWLNKNKTFNIFSESGLGLATYSNYVIQGYEYFIMRSAQLGSYGKFGFELAVFKSLCFTCNVGIFIASNNRFTVDNGYSKKSYELIQGQYESFSKLTASAGLSYKF